MVFQPLGDDPNKLEDLQGLQGLVGQKWEVYPVPVQTSMFTLSSPAL